MRAYGRGLVTGQRRVEVFERFGYACAHCGMQFDRPENDTGRFSPSRYDYVDKRGRSRVCLLEVDHIIPRVLGGDNRPENLQALCTQCNSRKGHRLNA